MAATEQEIKNAERLSENLTRNGSLQEIRNAERLSENLTRNGPLVSFSPPKTTVIRDAGLAGYGTPGMYSNPENAAASFTDMQAANFIEGFNGVKSGGTRRPQAGLGGFESLLAGFLGGGGVGGGSSRGPSASDALARDRFNYEKKQDDKKASGLSDYYTGGSYNTGFDALLKMIADQGKQSEGGVTKAYDRALTNINQGYDTASGLGTSGFNALNQYLQANPNNPYASMTAQVGSAPDALSNYLSAYGVSDAPVQGQIQADQLQAQQGAGNFQNLIDVLSGVAQQGAGSRGAESQMAQLMFDTGLGQERAGYASQAENAQAAALAQLQQQMFESRFGVEQNRNTLAQQLAQTIAELTGNAPTGPVPEEDEDEDEDKDKEAKGNPNLTPQVLAQLAARRRAEF